MRGFFQMDSDLLLVLIVSLIFLIPALRASGSAENRRLMALSAMFGLLYVLLGLLWHFRFAFLQSRAITIPYYFAWHFEGGIVLCMFAYASRLASPKVLLVASTALLAAFNLFAVARHHPSVIRSLWWADGLYGGVLVTSLVLLWLDQPRESRSTT